jgi:hypothetical protein
MNTNARLLYTLKRRYGEKTIFYRDSESLNFETGKKNVTKVTWTIKRAIVLPGNVQSKFVYDLAFIANNKEFTTGGIFDTGPRTLILDSKDLGTYEPQIRDHFNLNNQRYDVINFDFNTGYVIITGQRIVGAPAREVHNLNPDQRCIFSQEIEYES